MPEKTHRKLLVVTENHQDSFPRTVISGVQSAAQSYGFEIEEFSYEPDRFDPGRITLPLDDFEGLLVITDSIPDPALRAIYAAGYPLSLISHQINGLDIPNIATDNIGGMAELVRHIVTDCGRRHPVFIRGLMSHSDARQRESTFRQEMIHYNIRVPETHFLKGDFSARIAGESVREFLKQAPMFDAIVAADYLMGIAAVEALRASHIAVPQNVSVVGYGDGPEAETAGLTAVAASVIDLGICAVKQVMGQINGSPMSGTTVLGIQLMVRKTS